jgi:hypothetical protein
MYLALTIASSELRFAQEKQKAWGEAAFEQVVYCPATRVS